MRKRAGVLALGGVLMSVTTGCAQLFVGGLVALQGLLPVSRDQEVAMGLAAAQQIAANPQAHIVQDPTLTPYVNRIGLTMAQQSGRNDVPWTFTVLDQSQANAFALPGGFIYITTGALRAMHNEAELAGVLGHEVAHVAKRHGVDQMKKQLVAQGILISALGSSPQAAQLAGNLVATLVLRGYGREAELEADREGTRYASRAGYDPLQLAGFLDTLSRMTGDTPAWLEPLSDHPSASERIARIRQEVQAEHLTGDRLGAASFQSATTVLQGGGAGAAPRAKERRSGIERSSVSRSTAPVPGVHSRNVRRGLTSRSETTSPGSR